MSGFAVIHTAIFQINTCCKLIRIKRCILENDLRCKRFHIGYIGTPSNCIVVILACCNISVYESRLYNYGY